MMIYDRTIVASTPIVAALDFGTTYSGYAYSTIANYKRDPLLISVNRVWPAGVENLASYKTPTSILFNSDMTCKAFGFEAEDQYANLCSAGRQNEFPFFRNFKLHLQSTKNLDRNLTLESVQGGNAKAMTVFMESIKYLKQHLLDTVNDVQVTGPAQDNSQVLRIQSSEVKWVLTVPAIWDDSAKQFMREAAEKAGIEKDRLMIALEPEAASIYCRKLAVKRMNVDGVAVLEAFEPNTTYMVIDVGGGTTDITVHTISNNGSIEEVAKSSGGLWGGLKVDEEFNKILATFYSPQIMEKFHRENPEDSFILLKRLEFQKCSLQPGSTKWTTVVLPHSLRQLHADETQKLIPDCDQVRFVKDKVRFQSSFLNAIFQPTIESIMDHIKTLLRENVQARKAKFFFLVGGLSQSPLLVDALKRAFEGVKVIIPEDSLVAVLKGAVMYGHDPQNAIAVRISRLTYGIEVMRPFDQLLHKSEKKVVQDSEEMCKEICDACVREDERVVFGKKILRIYYPSAQGQTEAAINIYGHTCRRSDQIYVTDPEVKKLGTLVVKMPDTTGERDRQIAVTMLFGGTELHVSVVDPNSQQKFVANYDFLTK